MSEEAVIIEINNNNPIRFTTSASQAIEKGALLELDNPRSATNHGSVSGATTFAGIAAAEKTSASLKTNIACYVPGQGNIFDLVCEGGGAISAGDLLSMSGGNTLQIAVAADVEGGKIVGKALEDVAASATETIAVLV